ncbi:MAG: TIR domain-containing protein [Gallionellaceae bacterium]|jgi:hypothetical protein
MSLFEDIMKTAQLVRRKVFISYYHKDDQKYRDSLEEDFGHMFISKSVQPGDISTDVSTDYIKALINQDFLSDASVLLVLVGPKTLCRKHVDWEISAALSSKVGGNSGVAAILLPELPLLSDGFDPATLPPRFYDNQASGYAIAYKWSYATASEANMRSIIETAFEARLSKKNLISNSRIQMGRNTCE